MSVATLPEVQMPPTSLNGRDAPLYEVVDGRYVELEMSSYSVVLASRLHTRLDSFAEANQLGQAISEILVGLAERLRRRPDVSFVSYNRWPRGKPIPYTDPWPVVPELAVEVVSPNDLAEDLRLKIAEYFRYGVQMVWVVWPKLCAVDVYESLTQVRVLERNDVLDGGRVLPGFTLALADLFRESPPAEGAPADHA